MVPIHTLKVLDLVVGGVSFLTGDVFEHPIAHQRSVAVLCMLYKIRFHLMHPIYDALSVPYVPVRVTSGILIAHLFTCVLPRCRTSQYHRTFIPPLYICGTIFLTHVFTGVRRTGFTSNANTFVLAQAALSLFLSSPVFHFHLSFYGLNDVLGLRSFDSQGVNMLTLPCFVNLL